MGPVLVKGVRIGTPICEDAAPGCGRGLAETGAEILLIPTIRPITGETQPAAEPDDGPGRGAGFAAHCTWRPWWAGRTTRCSDGSSMVLNPGGRLMAGAAAVR